MAKPIWQHWILNFLSQEVEDSVLPDMDFTKKPNLDYFTRDFGIFGAIFDKSTSGGLPKQDIFEIWPVHVCSWPTLISCLLSKWMMFDLWTFCMKNRGPFCPPTPFYTRWRLSYLIFHGISILFVEFFWLWNAFWFFCSLFIGLSFFIFLISFKNNFCLLFCHLETLKSKQKASFMTHKLFFGQKSYENAKTLFNFF